MRKLDQINMKHNIAYHPVNANSVDTQRFWNETLDGLTASEWVARGLRLASIVKAGKVNPELISDDNNTSAPNKNFSHLRT